MKTKTQSRNIACVILAAGKGTRMKSAFPKVMHQVAHKPMLFHVVDAALALKPEKIVTVTAPDMAEVRSALKSRYRDSVDNAVQQEPLGTGDAVKAAKSLKDFGGTVLVLYGDAPLVTPETLQALHGALLSNPKHAIAVLGMEIHAHNEYGRLVLDKKGHIQRIVEVRDATEKEKTIAWCNSGVMAVRGKLLFPLLARLKNKNAKKEYYLTDLVALARGDGHSVPMLPACPAELTGINSRAELASAENLMQWRLRRAAMDRGVTLTDPASVYFAFDTKLGRDITIHPHVVFAPGVEVEDGVEIRSFCHIEGTKIAASAIIGPFARLRPGSVIGEAAHVGNFVEIKKTTVERGAKVNHLSYVGDAHIGEAANVGAGTITCNYDGYTKHRTIVGAGAFIGSNTALVAPVIIGDRAIIGAGSVITEDVEPDALAIARAPQKQKLQWAKTFRNRKNN